MFLDAALSGALDRIAARAADVRRAFTPGAIPTNDDTLGTPRASFTLDPLSIALPPETSVPVATRAGTRYTRDGSFHLDGTRLVDAAGNDVLGRVTGSAPLAPLAIDPVDAALGAVQAPRIEADGSLVYTRDALDPRSGARDPVQVVVGRIALARFPAATRPPRDDGSTFAAPEGVVPHLGLPGDGTFARVAPMQREAGRIDLDAGLARLKDAYLAFDALQAAQHARGSLGKTAMDLLK